LTKNNKVKDIYYIKNTTEDIKDLLKNGLDHFHKFIDSLSINHFSVLHLRGWWRRCCPILKLI